MLDNTIVKDYIGYISFICEFIAEHNYKLSGKDPASHRSLRAVFVWVLIPGPVAIH